MRALRGARDLYVRGLRGLDRLLAAASPRRAGVGRPTSRVFGTGGDRDSEELMQELVRAMQARRGAAASAGAGGSGEGGCEVAGPRRWRGSTWMRPSLIRPADGGGVVDVVTGSEFRRYAVGRGALAWNPSKDTWLILFYLLILYKSFCSLILFPRIIRREGILQVVERLRCIFLCN